MSEYDKKAEEIALRWCHDFMHGVPVGAGKELVKVISAAMAEAAADGSYDRVFREGLGEHITDLVEAAKPFYECEMNVKKLSCHHWNTLWRAYKNALTCEVYRPKTTAASPAPAAP
jgi:hypothetical protein